MNWVTALSRFWSNGKWDSNTEQGGSASQAAEPETWRAMIGEGLRRVWKLNPTPTNQV